MSLIITSIWLDIFLNILKPTIGLVIPNINQPSVNLPKPFWYQFLRRQMWVDSVIHYTIHKIKNYWPTMFHFFHKLKSVVIPPYKPFTCRYSVLPCNIIFLAGRWRKSQLTASHRYIGELIVSMWWKPYSRYNQTSTIWVSATCQWVVSPGNRRWHITLIT